MIRLPRALGTLPATQPAAQSCADLGPGFHPEIGPDGMPTGYCIGCGQNAYWDGRGCACYAGYVYPGYGQDCVGRYALEETPPQGGSSPPTPLLVGLGLVLGLGLGAIAFSK